jgi:hypothetical protein
MPENEQAESTVDNQAEAVENQVEEAPVIEQIGELLKGNQSTEPEPIQEEVTEQQEEPKEVKEVQPEFIIDDAMIQQYPTLKMYRGKKVIEDLPKAYHNIVLAYAEDHKRLKQIEKEQAKQKLPEPSQIPDPVEKPDEFKKWLADYTDRVRLESAPPPPEIDWVARAKAVLPKEADFEKVRDNFMNFNAERFFNELGELRPEVASFYEKNPNILINEMKSHYQLASQAEKNAMTIQSEAKNTAYNTIKTSLKKANENKEDLSQAQFNQVSRTSVSTPEDDLLALIYKKAQGK